MLFRVDFPDTVSLYVAGTITQWHKSPGDVVMFGEELFDVEITRIHRLGKTKRAALLSRSGRSLKRLKSESDERTPRGSVTVRATAAEPEVHLREVLVGVDENVPVGTAVALVSSTADEPCPRDTPVGDLVPMRAVLNTLHEPD